MAAPKMDSWTIALKTLEELKAQLRSDHPLFDDIGGLLEQMRIACETTIFEDFKSATANGVENCLWEAHTVVNNRYRKLVAHYRAGDPKKHAVEQRKLEKRYADFIKTSQFFYKGYIQRLASHFDGMKNLRRIAHRLSLDLKTADRRIKVSLEVEGLIESSCHATLLRLGDLSRYRNILRQKERSWEPALAYYSLASSLHPDAGSSQNQMAVIALADGRHLDALYYLYRAIAVEEPYELAKGNLEIEFRKITNAWEKGSSAKDKGNTEAFIVWFTRLHARFYRGLEFAGREELETEVLHQLSVQLKADRSIEATLERFVIINVAAEYFASVRFREQRTAEAEQAYMFLLSFNIRTFSMLLEVLQPELEEFSEGEDLPAGADTTQSKAARDKITVITRRVLPALRQYSTWLVSRAKVIGVMNDPNIKLYIRKLHKNYAGVLTRLAESFPVVDLPEVAYLLEEDESTIGFKPFRDPDLPPQCNLYVDGSGMKPRITDPGVKRNHPNTEMLARVRDIMLCGLTLAVDDDYPISMDLETRIFTSEEDLVSSGLLNGHPTSAAVVSPISEPAKFVATASSFKPAVTPLREYTDDTASIADSSVSMETYMHNMVNSLVEPAVKRSTDSNETSYGMHSQTANEVFAAPTHQTGFANHRASFSTPKMIPSLGVIGGIWSSPFTPQPNELQSISPERPGTARQLSPLQLSTSEHQFQAAQALDEITGYRRSSKNSWDRIPSQPGHQDLKESLAQQSAPYTMSSSGFTNASSLYQNTPQPANRNRDGNFAHGSHAAGFNGNNTTTYTGTSEFDRLAMLQSSLYYGSEPSGWQIYNQTPPGGQGG